MPEWGGANFTLFDARIRKRCSDVVVFTPAVRVDADELREAVRGYFERRAPPDRVFLLGSQVVKDELIRAAKEGWIPDALKGVTGDLDRKRIVPLAFDVNGEVTDLLGLAQDLEGPGTVARMMRSGLWEIFERNHGLHKAGPAYHFVNPSRVHTAAFIRTGDVLRHSAEVGFIAMQLLRWWPRRDPRQIYVDTAAIVSVAYALLDLRKAFVPGFVTPAIDSFGGYDDLRSFQPRPNALCLISASISGKLEDRIRAKSDLDVITLFYGGPRLHDHRHIVCDLVDRDGSSPGIEQIESHREAECELCRAGRDVVQFSGDQFLPASPLVEPVLVKGTDAPDRLGHLVEALVGRSAVRCHHLTKSQERRDIHLQLDLDGALKAGNPLRKAFDRQTNAVLPAAITAIVHTDDAPSRELAALVERQYHAVTESPRTLRTWSTTTAAIADPAVAGKGDTVAVVTAVAGSGRELLRISQILRRDGGADGIVYLVALSRLLDATERTRIENNLTQADWTGRFRIVNGECCYLPRREESPWNRERWFLEGLLAEHDEGSEEGQAVRARLDQIEAPELIDELFLPSIRDGELDPRSGKLVVGEGFVFWRRVDERIYDRHTQADAYLTISAILHAMRGRQDGRPTLAQRGHNRAVLDPANFSRFTDGALQAAFLRAAESRELQYNSRDDLSGQMLDIVEGMLEDVEAEASAALPEFLLALAGGHVRLTKLHMRRLADRLEGLELPPLLRALRGRIIKMAE